MSKNWQKVFFKNIDTYIGIINSYLSEKFHPQTLNNYVKIIGGYAFKSSLYRKSGIPIIRISDFSNEQINLNNVKFYDETSELDRYQLYPGDIIIALTGGTIGKLAVVQEGLGKIYLNQRVGKFEILDKEKFHNSYIYWLARGVQSKIKSIAWGGAQPNVSPRQIENMQFPIPDKTTQIKISSFLTDLSENKLKNKLYFNLSSEKEILKLQKNTIKIDNLTSEICYQNFLLKQIRQAILHEAVQGKLTAEWRKRHPELISGENHAARLLEKIKAEKMALTKNTKGTKKIKELPPISEDEKPFDLPDGWVWCRLGNVTSKIGSGSTPRGGKDVYVQSGVKFFRSQNIHNDGINLDDIVFIDQQIHKRMSNTAVLPNDILLNITGGSIGRAALISEDFDSGNVSQHVSIIRTLLLNNSFIHKVILSPYFQKLIFNSTTGAGREGLPKYNLEKFVISIPPLAEQQAIVEKVDRLMAKIDELEEQVKARKEQAEQLMQAVLREAFNGD